MDEFDTIMAGLLPEERESLMGAVSQARGQGPVSFMPQPSNPMAEMLKTTSAKYQELNNSTSQRIGQLRNAMLDSAQPQSSGYDSLGMALMAALPMALGGAVYGSSGLGYAGRSLQQTVPAFMRMAENRRQREAQLLGIQNRVREQKILGLEAENRRRDQELAKMGQTVVADEYRMDRGDQRAVMAADRSVATAERKADVAFADKFGDSPKLAQVRANFGSEGVESVRNANVANPILGEFTPKDPMTTASMKVTADDAKQAKGFLNRFTPLVQSFKGLKDSSYDIASDPARFSQEFNNFIVQFKEAREMGAAFSQMEAKYLLGTVPAEYHEMIASGQYSTQKIIQMLVAKRDYTTLEGIRKQMGTLGDILYRDIYSASTSMPAMQNYAPPELTNSDIFNLSPDGIAPQDLGGVQQRGLQYFANGLPRSVAARKAVGEYLFQREQQGG
jgi:hypothetical protein